MTVLAVEARASNHSMLTIKSPPSVLMPTVLPLASLFWVLVTRDRKKLREMANHSEESESGLQVYRTWDSLVDRVVCKASMKHDPKMKKKSLTKRKRNRQALKAEEGESSFEGREEENEGSIKQAKISSTKKVK